LKYSNNDIGKVVQCISEWYGFTVGELYTIIGVYGIIENHGTDCILQVVDKDGKVKTTRKDIFIIADEVNEQEKHTYKLSDMDCVVNKVIYDKTDVEKAYINTITKLFFNYKNVEDLIMVKYYLESLIHILKKE